MGKSEKQMDKEQRAQPAGHRYGVPAFVEKKIEAVSMDEVAKRSRCGTCHIVPLLQQ